MTVEQINFAHSFTFDGVMLKVFHANKGEGLPSHEHEYAHATVCHAGKCAIRKENVYVEMTKESQPVTLVANQWHEIEALEDGTVFCNVFAEGKD
jgi:quercetin dioxygenase-like cupin family protein